MNKSELIKTLAEQSDISMDEATLVVNTFFDCMKEALLQGDRVEIRGFGSFSVNYRPARKGRNPKSGEAVSVPAKYVPHFKAGKEMRERVEESAKPAALRRAA